MSKQYTPAFADPKGILIKDPAGYAVLCVASGAPPGKVNGTGTALPGYQKGCMYLRTDGTAGVNGVFYVNGGTVLLNNWTPIY